MATHVTAVINQKGGAGKTTLAMNLAAGLARRAETVVIDLDPQGSSRQWSSLGSAPFPATVKQIAGKWDARSLHQSFRAYRHLVLDCPPSIDSHASLQALRACDVALIPVLPSPIDLWASLRLPQEIEEARKTNKDLKAYLVLNQLEPKSALSAAMHEALAEFGVPVLSAAIRRRAAYRSAALEGVSVYQMGSRGAQAAAEIEAVINEVIPS
ncbi:MAG: ParA family protein [Thiobacillaceae bacterium]|jgi:chromosome partitioning protein|nr:ParA family protein [Thiobacillaceae bacterium]